MNAAAYLLFLRKRQLLHPTLILGFSAWGGLGVLLGLAVAAPSAVPTTKWPPGECRPVASSAPSRHSDHGPIGGDPGQPCRPGGTGAAS